MADDLGLSGLASTASNAASGAYTIVITLLCIGVLVGIILLVNYILSYKHHVNVKIMTKNGFYFVHDKAREIDENGVKFWKLLKMKITTTVPPPEAIDITKKGKFVATGYFSEETDMVWLTDKNTKEDFKNLIEEEIVEYKNGVPIRRKVVKNAFHPFTTQERALQANRVTRAMLRKKKNLLEILTQLAVPAALIILVICVLIFWEDIAKPVQNLATINAEVSKQNAEIAEQNARILNMIAKQGGLQTVEVTQTIDQTG